MGLEPTASRATIWRASQLRHTHHIIRNRRLILFQACSKGFEPPTHGLEGRCSIQLSYEHIPADHQPTQFPDYRYRLLFYLRTAPQSKRVMGIEPTYPAWKAGVLPLNYTRIYVKRLNRGDRIRTCDPLVPNQVL